MSSTVMNVEAHSDPAAIGRAWLNLFSTLE